MTTIDVVTEVEAIGRGRTPPRVSIERQVCGERCMERLTEAEGLPILPKRKEVISRERLKEMARERARAEHSC